MKKILITSKSLVIAMVAMVFPLNTILGQVATLQNWTNVYHGTSQSLQNPTYSVPSGSNTNRLLVVAVSSSKWGTGQITVTMSYGGQPLTLAAGDMTTNNVKQHTALYYLNEAGLDAATSSTLSATVSAGGATMVNTDIWAAVFDYVNQTSPLTNTRSYSSGTGQVTNFQFAPALTINAYNQAVEVVNSYNPQYNILRTIYYDLNWAKVRDSTAIYYGGGSSGASVRNGVANRSIPSSGITDASPTSFDLRALASMTALSLNFEMPPAPTDQASNVTFTDVTSSSFTINWTSGNGTNRIVLIKAGSAVDSDPVDGTTTYTASNLYGGGSQIGTGNYVLYDGTGNSVTVNNLDGGTTYHVAIYEFSRPGALRDYLTPPATGSQLTEAETASNGAYRSYVSGNWSAPGTWQTFDGTSWGIAVSAPSSTSGAITIRDGHTITVDKNVTADQVTVEAGAQVEVSPGVTWTIADGSDAIDCSIDGTLYNSGTVTTTGVLAFNSNSTYNHAANGSTIPTATWDANSLCLVTGITNTAPTGFGQSFGNFTWNCASQTITAVMNSNTSVQGDFRLSGTGTGKLSITDSNNPIALTVSGNYFQTAGTFDLNSGTSSSAVATLNVAGNFSFTGGTITETSSGRGSVVFNGTGPMQIYTSGGILANTIDFTVAGGAYLQMGTGLNPSYISLSNGTFTLSSSATLGITDLYGITTSTNGSSGGNIRVTGIRNFDTGANYIYNGSTNQNTGNGLPLKVNSLVFNNSGKIIAFNSGRTITNNFSITTGSNANLNAFTHKAGALTLGGVGQPVGSYGGIGSGANYELSDYFTAGSGIVNNQPPIGTWLGFNPDWNDAQNWIGGVPTSQTNATISSYATNQPLISGATAAVCNILTINSSASLTVSGSAVFTSAENLGTLTVNPGGQATITTLTNNGTVNLEADASGMFSLMLDSYAGTTGTVNAGLYLTGGNPGSEMWRWHYLAVPFQQNKSVLTDINPVDLMNYLEPSALNDIWEGWQWHDGYDGTTSFNNLLVTEGYNFYNSEDTYVTFSGNLLMPSLSVKNLSFSVFGWNFFGNSLTCGLNWDNVILNGNMNTAVHFLKDYQEYYYIKGGPGLPLGTTGHIPPLQGFFVQAHASGASIDFTNAREHNDTPYYKGDSGNNESKSSFPLIRLTLGNDRHRDEMMIWFNDNATMGFDNKFDARKWVPEDLRTQIYSVSQGREYAINGIPSPSASVSIPVAFRVPEDGTYSINQTSLENMENYGFYLKDLKLNTTVNLKSNPEYSFSASKGTVKDRFVLIIENLSAGINDISVSDKPFNVYSSKGYINIELMSDMWDGRQGSVKVIDLTGRTLIDSRNLEFSKSSLIQLPVKDNKGFVIVEMLSGPLRHTARVMIR